MISLGWTGSPESTSFHFPHEDFTLTGVPSIRLLTLNAISSACLSSLSELPGPKGSKCVSKSVGGSDESSESGGHIHSIDAGASFLSGNECSVWEDA